MVLTVPATVGCEAHKAHAPAPTYLEVHHIIPQAWQKFWRPSGESIGLWDTRTAALCRTGHGNVHWWLVKMMKRYQFLAPKTLPLVPVLLNGDKFVRKDAGIAYLAMQRFQAAGGDLLSLCEVKLYGYI